MIKRTVLDMIYSVFKRSFKKHKDMCFYLSSKSLTLFFSISNKNDV